MRYLLDTNAFLWWDTRSDRLPKHIFEIISDPATTIQISMVSLWEIQIKHQLGKLDLSKPLEQIVREQREKNGFRLLTIDLPHVLALSTLPDHHRDPFDRLLIAQAMIEHLTLITNDAQIARYPVQTVW